MNCRKGSSVFGRLSLFGGLPKDRAQVPLDVNRIHYKNLVVTGMTGGPMVDFRAVLSMVAAGRIDPTRVISHVFAREDMAQAFQTAVSGDCLKVVLSNEA